MINVALLGKEYQDFNFSLSSVCIGETNKADNLTKEFGGVYNLLKPQIENINFLFFTQGTKDAFIINEKQKSRRTSITRDGKESIYKQKDISTINKSCDWAHVCYIDDIEDYSSFFSFKVPFSIDFCTTNKRESYIQVIDQAAVVFDSRERFSLYEDISTSTPIIFHDEKGIEIIKSKKIIHKSDITPISGLDVNGAGDIYAANYIKYYTKYDIIDSANKAMLATTAFLKNQETKNE